MDKRYYAVEHFNASDSEPIYLVVLPYKDKEKAREYLKGSIADLTCVSSFTDSDGDSCKKQK